MESTQNVQVVDQTIRVALNHTIRRWTVWCSNNTFCTTSARIV